MIEVNTTWELIPHIDQEAYDEFAKKSIDSRLKAPGLIEFRASRNMLGSPQVRSTSVFRNLADWASFTDSDEWRHLEADLRNFATNIRVDIWGPSPLLPKPVRPG